MRIVSFLLLMVVKVLSAIFYHLDVRWLSSHNAPSWNNVRLLIFLNHTSLFEPLFLNIAPVSFIWRLSRDLLLPGADVTLKRPVLGRFIRALVPGCIPISRKKDATWSYFMSQITPHSVIVILPEGRMKRRDGRDKHGNDMNVRGGIVEVLQQLEQGMLLFIYSGGLHHVQAPGDRFPRLFKRIRANLELVDIAQYKVSFTDHCTEFRCRVIRDLNTRLKQRLPD